MKNALETYGLTKRFGTLTAVDGLSLNVEPGEIYGFLGLNGAGKTTTIRMLLGLIRPSKGHAEVLGTRVRRGASSPWSEVGYLVETPHAYPELTVRENLNIVRRLRSLPDAKVVDNIIERLALNHDANRRVRTLSLGNAQRLGLAKALLHNPRLIILDEPSNGLDPAGIVEVRELLRDLAHNHGVTIFMSSHILEEVSKLAGRIGIIHQGRLLMERNAEELERERRRRLLVNCRDTQTGISTLLAAGIDATLSGDAEIQITNDRALEHPEEIAKLLVQSGSLPTMLKVEREDLESYFLRLVGINHEETQ